MNDKLNQFTELLRSQVFPEFYPAAEGELSAVLASLTDRETAESFLEKLPEIRQLILSDVEAVQSVDPAASDREEVIRCYPAVEAMLHFRAAHTLLKLGVKILPRMLTERAHSKTGIDIHPAASIGASFAIDHGTGIVIGATSIIGKNVTLYQGVTLGAKNFSYDASGAPMDIPRHPVLEDGVTVYSNASILGRVTIGHDSVIGGNVWLTVSVPPYSRIVQGKAIYESGFENGAGAGYLKFPSTTALMRSWDWTLSSGVSFSSAQ